MTTFFKREETLKDIRQINEAQNYLIETACKTGWTEILENGLIESFARLDVLHNQLRA